MWRLVTLYLFAIVAANLLVAEFGPSVSVLNAFLFIGLDITVRDHLHERWERLHLWRNMALLIGVGAALSAALNWNSLPIAAASCIAFAAAGVVDTLVFKALGNRARLVRVNGSNVVSAAADSIIFPLLAFGMPLLWPIVVGQFAAKVIGGGVWSLVLKEAGSHGL